MFKTWHTIATRNEEDVKEFLEVMSKYTFRVYAVRERPEHLRPDVSYSDVCSSGMKCYFPVPEIIIYILATKNEYCSIRDIWNQISFKMTKWMGDNISQSVNASQNYISSPTDQTTSSIASHARSCVNEIAQQQEINRLQSMLASPIYSPMQLASTYQTGCSTLSDQRNLLDRSCIMSTRDQILYADDKPYMILTPTLNSSSYLHFL